MQRNINSTFVLLHWPSFDFGRLFHLPKIKSQGINVCRCAYSIITAIPAAARAPSPAPFLTAAAVTRTGASPVGVARTGGTIVPGTPGTGAGSSGAGWGAAGGAGAGCVAAGGAGAGWLGPGAWICPSGICEIGWPGFAGGAG